MTMPFKRRQKLINKEKEIQKNHEKNIRNKLRDKYENYFVDNGMMLHKINMNFIPTIKKSKNLTWIEPISGLSGLEFIPYLYVCSKSISGLSQIKNRIKEKITPRILIESIILTYYKTTGGDFKEVNIRKGDEPLKYFMQDNNGFNIYIKLNKKKEHEIFWTGEETKSIIQYKKNKMVYDETLFNAYIKQLKREINVHKKKFDENNNVSLEIKIEPKSNLEFCMTKKGSLCGLILQRKYEDNNFNPILYRYVPEQLDLNSIDSKIYSFLEKSIQATNLDISALNKIPLVNDNFDNPSFEIFKDKFNGIINSYQQEI